MTPTAPITMRTAADLLDAVAEVADAVGIKYFNAKKTVTQGLDGEFSEEWSCYIAGGSHYTARTGEASLQKMKAAIAAAQDHLTTGEAAVMTNEELERKNNIGRLAGAIRNGY